MRRGHGCNHGSFYLSLFPSSSPKGVFLPTVFFQCLQTNTSQIAGFLTCSLLGENTGQIRKKIFEKALKRSTWLAGNTKIARSIGILQTAPYCHWKKVRRFYGQTSILWRKVWAPSGKRFLLMLWKDFRSWEGNVALFLDHSKTRAK